MSLLLQLRLATGIKSLKFEDQGEKGSWLHLSFLLSCSFFSSPILLTCFWSFQDLELEEEFVDSQNSCLMLWKWSHCLWTLQMLEADFFLEGLSWVPQNFPFPCHCSIKVSSSNSSPAFTLCLPWRPFCPGAKHNHLNSFPLGIHLVHRKHHLLSRLWECSYFPTTSVLEISNFCSVSQSTDLCPSNVGGTR